MFLWDFGSPTVIFVVISDLDKAFWVCHPQAVAKGLGTRYAIHHLSSEYGMLWAQSTVLRFRDWNPSSSLGFRGKRPAQFGAVGTASHWMMGLMFGACHLYQMLKSHDPTLLIRFWVSREPGMQAKGYLESVFRTTYRILGVLYCLNCSVVWHI